MSETYQEYATTDITLAAVLKEWGCELDRIQIDRRKGIFYFRDVEKQKLIDYDTGKLLVEPVAFHSAIRTLATAVQRMLKD